MLEPFRLAWRVIRNVIRGFSDDELMTRAAALAFYSALSFAPMLVLLLWVAASLRPEWQNQLIDSLTGLVGERAGEGVRLVVQNAGAQPHLGNMAGLIGLGVTLFGASLVFTQLQRAINRIWGVRPRPGRAWLDWLRARMHAMGLLLTLAFLLIISFGASTLIAIFVKGNPVIWQGLDVVIAFGVFIFVFAAIFKVLPDAIITWKDALIGAGLTALLFALGKYGISIYLDHSKVGGAYGPAGGVVVLLVWVYYSAVILLLGAELTEALAYERGTPIEPRAHAMRLHPENDDTPPGNDAFTDAT